MVPVDLPEQAAFACQESVAQIIIPILKVRLAEGDATCVNSSCFPSTKSGFRMNRCGTKKVDLLKTWTIFYIRGRVSLFWSQVKWGRRGTFRKGQCWKSDRKSLKTKRSPSFQSLM